MRKLEMVQLLRRDVKALIKLSPWLLLSLLLAAVLWSTDLSTSSGLFQSPPETTPPTGPGTPVVTPTLTLTPSVTLTPTAVVTPTAGMTPTAEVTATLAPEVSPTVTEVPPAPAPTEETGSPGAPDDESRRYNDEDASLSYEWGMLFDSVALMASYAWLCCGGLIFLLIPVVFVALWVAYRRQH
jgi:hypothetical protein